MDLPQHREVVPTRSRAARALHAVTSLEPPTQLAIAAIVCGWFLMNTLVVHLGVMEHGVAFFDFGAVMADPTRMFFGVDSPVQRVAFGMLCLACAFAPALPFPMGTRSAAPSYRWLAYLAPLLLMILCAIILYSNTSADLLATPSDPASFTGGIVHFANDLVKRGGGVVSRHITVGAGAYLALFGSAVLALQGIRGHRRASAR